MPALDNGEWVWGLRAVIYQLKQMKGYDVLLQRYQNYFDMLAKNVVMIFYDGEGLVRAVTQIRDTQASPVRRNYFQQRPCGRPCYLDDPYEGEMITFFMYLYGDWNGREQGPEKLWVVKRPKLQAVNFQVNPQQNITVQRGWWFSAHEQWKYLELPYLDSSINRRVFLNGERARSWNSVINGYPGMFASVNDVATPPSLVIPDYLSSVGIPSIAFEEVTKYTTITPYGCFPLFLTGNRGVALSWYLTMLQGPSMQGPFGSTEACNVTGTAVSPVLTWDAKITTFAAMIGGMSDITRAALQEDGLYNQFLQRVDNEWNLKFGGDVLQGEDLPFQIPNTRVPYPSSLGDFSTCQV